MGGKSSLNFITGWLPKKGRVAEPFLTLKLETNRNYSVYERGCPLLIASLFTLKFFIVLKSKVMKKSQTLA